MSAPEEVTDAFNWLCHAASNADYVRHEDVLLAEKLIGEHIAALEQQLALVTAERDLALDELQAPE